MVRVFLPYNALHANAVYDTTILSVCPCVCLSQLHVICVQTTKRIKRLAYLIVCYKWIQSPQKLVGVQCTGSRIFESVRIWIQTGSSNVGSGRIPRLRIRPDSGLDPVYP